jgi:UDP-glucose 4-epimerase
VLHHPQVALVTGAAGFIGSHLVERLLRDGWYVVGVDSFSDYYSREMKERNIASARSHKRFTLVETDLLDLDLTGLLEGKLSTGFPVKYIFHLAAQPGVRASWGKNFQVYTRNNVLATQRLLEAAKETQLTKIVFASSSSVYGDAEALPTSEEAIPRPLSPYGVTKLAAEHLCLLYWRNYGLPVVCLRYFTVYGPRQRPDMAFHRFIKAISEENEITVYGDGEQTRDFTYVDDTVEATVKAGTVDLSGVVLNIGNGLRVSVNRAIQVIEDLIGKQARVKYLESVLGDARHTAADTKRARTMLGFQPRISLREGLQAEVEWFREHCRYGNG